MLYEKAKKELQPSSNFKLAAFKTVSRRESRAEARARARCRTMEKKKKKKMMMMLLEAGYGGIGQFDSTEHLLFDSTGKVPSLVSSILEYPSCSSLSQGTRRLVDDDNIPLCMLDYRQSKDQPLIWDDADVDASYELLPSGVDQ